MPISYEQKCATCKKNFVTITWRQRFPICYECQKSELQGKIKDPKMKVMFDIPEEFYKENLFLRNIKSNYLRFNSLTEKQVEAFKKTVKKIKERDGKGGGKGKSIKIEDNNSE